MLDNLGFIESDAQCKSASRESGHHLYVRNANPTTTFGDRLRESLERSQRSRKALATAIGVTPQAIGMLVNGITSEMAAVNLLRTSAFLNVDPVWLATGAGEPEPPGSSPYARRLARRFDERVPDERREAVYAAISALLDAAVPATHDPRLADRAPPAAPPPPALPTRRR